MSTATFPPPSVQTKQEPDRPPMLIYPGFGQTEARERTIATVHFQPIGPYRFHHNGRCEYYCAPPEHGKANYLRLYDTQQWVPNAENQDVPYGADMRPMPVPVESVVRNILENCTGGFIGSVAHLKPGIGQIAGRECTKDELQKLLDREVIFSRAIIREADEIWERRWDKREKRVIGPLHRGALEWMGSEKRDWYKEIEPGRFKVSPITGNKIPMEAMVDGNTDLVKFYIEWELDPMKFGDEFIADFMRTNPKAQRMLAEARRVRELDPREPTPAAAPAPPAQDSRQLRQLALKGQPPKE